MVSREAAGRLDPVVACRDSGFGHGARNAPHSPMFSHLLTPMTRTIVPAIPDTASVVIAGAGPVGLALAAELGRLGIDCLVVEKRTGELSVPKMSQVSSRNMEFCRRWGIADQVKSAVWPESHALDFVYAESLRGAELARVRLPSYATRRLDYTPEGACHCPQIYFDPILAAHVRGLPSVALRYGTALESFVEQADGVRLRLRDEATGTASEVAARFLVGCDGPAGQVRDGLGIARGGEGVVARSVNVFFRSAELAQRHDKGWARFYRLLDESGCWAELIPIDGAALWRLTVFDDPQFAGDAPAYLRRTLGDDFRHEILSVMTWDRRDIVAASYGGARVFIAGDAAHECSPTGGLGMHTGIEEAVNLAWKLAAVLQGWGGVRLLASYAQERRPIALRNVALATAAFRAIRALPSAAEAKARGLDDRLASLTVGEPRKTHIVYEESPICVADGSSAPAEPAPSARPGARAPHAWLTPQRSTLDLYGDGFVLLRFPGAPAAAGLQAAAGARKVPLAAIEIADDAVAALHQRRLVLVRPDGHVAWRGDALPPDVSRLIDRIRGA